MVGRFPHVAAVAVTLLLATAACGTDTEAPSNGESGSVVVFAAASLTESFGELQTALKSSTPGLSVTYSFAGSGALVTQVQQGAPADVIATADTASMSRLTDGGLVETPVVFARNRLEILVEPGNPKRISGLSDLSRTDIKLVLGDETVPFGRFSAQALQAAGVAADPVSKEPDVKAAVAKVTSGEADVAIVYVTDVAAAGSRGQGVEIPDDQNVVIEYPIAIVKTTGNRPAAVAFVDAVVEGRGQGILQENGFLAG